MSKKLFSFINKKIENKDVFDKIESKTDFSNIKKSSKHKLRLPLSFATCAVVLTIVSLGVTKFVYRNNGDNNIKPLGPVVDGGLNSTDTNIGAFPPSDATPGGIVKPGVDVGDDMSHVSPPAGGDLTGDSSAAEPPKDGSSLTTDDDPTISDNTQQSYKILTGSEWSDIKNYTYWKQLVSGEIYYSNQNQLKEFKQYYDYVHQNVKNIASTKNLINFRFLSDECPINNAKVTIYDSNSKYYTAMTNVNGNAFLFLPENYSSDFSIDVEYSNNKFSYSYIYNELPGDHFISQTENDLHCNQYEKLDLSFLIDTTGSMGDELVYIANELVWIIGSIKESNANYDIQTSFVLYRDECDAYDSYVTKFSDFNSSVIESEKYIKAQGASGGGDYEEAIQLGLKEVNDLSWRDNSLKMCFHIFDAPCHDKHMSDVYEEVYKASEKGIRLIPIACSGLTKIGEFMAREEAILTGGTYTYLTDDSGIGNPHTIATTNEKVEVEKLCEMIVRIVKEYLTGEVILPTPIQTSQISSYKYNGSNGNYTIKDLLIDQNHIYAKGEFNVKLESLEDIYLEITIDALNKERGMYGNVISKQKITLDTSKSQTSNGSNELIFNIDQNIYDYIVNGAKFRLTSTFGLVGDESIQFSINYFTNIKIIDGKVTVLPIQ